MSSFPHQAAPAFLPTLEKELKRLQKPLYNRMMDFVQAHPLLALTITSLFGLALNVVASVIFEKLKKLWPALS